MFRLGAGLPLRSSSVTLVRTLAVSASGSGKYEVRRVSKMDEPETEGVDGDAGRRVRAEVDGNLYMLFAIGSAGGGSSGDDFRYKFDELEKPKQGKSQNESEHSAAGAVADSARSPPC
jgi:hypothetical protein